MKAVNLIPSDQRRGAGGLAGRSGGIMYVLVGGLAVIVGLGVVYAFAVKSVADRKGQLADVTAQVNAVQAQAATYQPYLSVERLRQGAVSGVVTLAEQRFDWPDAMRQLSLALPADVTLTSMNGTVASGNAGTATSTTAVVSGPQFSLQGCASSQAEVGTLITRLQQVPDVTGVSLTSATKNADTAPNAGKPVGPNQAEAIAGQCKLVSFSLALTYSSNYTLPNEKLPAPSTGRTQTASTAHASARVTTPATTSKASG